jgi:nucleoside-diphosphate-sugar epimerase
LQSKSVLFLGFGDIARRTATLLPDCRCVGVARSARKTQDGIEFWQGAADSILVRERLQQQTFDAVVLTLTPTEYSPAAYELSYVETLRNLLPVWRVNPPGLILLVSSTSVYHQGEGEWVDEDSPTHPEHFSGRSLLEAEALLRDSDLKTCVMRFAGIYGPGRDFLLRQVRAGKGGSADFTNRIHADDCAGALAHVLRRGWRGEPLAPLYLGCDSSPAPGTEVRHWLARRIGIDPDSLVSSISERGGNKRCCNRRLLAAGYQLRYPSYREGYSALLESGEIG